MSIILRDAVAMALSRGVEPMPSHYQDADRAIAEIRKHHAIVERVGEDARAVALEAAGAAVGQSRPYEDDVVVAVDAVIPIIAAHARAATLEEAAKACDGDLHLQDSEMRAYSKDFAARIRALK